MPGSLLPLLRLFTLVCVCSLPTIAARAAQVVGAPEVLPGPTGGMVIRWRTDVPTGSRVTYGLSTDHMSQTATGTVTDLHEVALNGLQPGAKYFYTIGTARKQLTTGHFIASSSPNAVATQASTSPAVVPPVTPKPKSLLEKVFAPKGEAPPARETWGNPSTLPDHFARHGADFGAKSPDDYAQQAWQFRQRARAGQLLVKIDRDGVQRVFDPATGAFAAYNRDGTTKTYFKPGSRDYFDRQPGAPAKTVTP